MDEDKFNNRIGLILVAYLVIVGVASVAYLIAAFPSIDDSNKMTFPFFTGGADRPLLLLAFAAGVTGSFIHAAQSLSTYLGNAQFKVSWSVWYLLRPAIGGFLGLAIYFAFRAGLIGGANGVNPYGVVAIGILGGWFSKTTTDKLQEVFETLFTTDEDRKRKDKLEPFTQPVIESVAPSPVPAGVNEFTITGLDFIDGAKVLFNGSELTPVFDSETRLRLRLDAAHRPAAGTAVNLRVKNPDGDNSISNTRQLTFE